MRKMMILFLLLVSTGAGVYAQKQNKMGAVAGKDMAARRATRLAGEMKLDKATAKWFTSLYAEYQDSLKSVRRSAAGVRVPADSLTDARAEQLIEERFRQSETETAVKRAFYARFREKLSPVQLVKVFAASDSRQGMRRTMPHQRMQQGGARGFGGEAGSGDGW